MDDQTLDRELRAEMRADDSYIGWFEEPEPEIEDAGLCGWPTLLGVLAGMAIGWPLAALLM